MAKIKPLRQSPLCQGLTFREIASVAQEVEEIKLKDGDNLSASNFQGLIVLAQGRIQVIYDSSAHGSSREKNDSLVKLVIQEGEYFGELSLLSGQGKNAGEFPLKIVAKGDCRILRMVSENFQELLEEEPIVGLKMIKNISTHLQKQLFQYQKFVQKMIAAQGKNLPLKS